MRLPAGVREPFTASTSTACDRSWAATSASTSGRLVFGRELVKEGRLGFWRWFLGAWGIGTYGRNDQVDVAWEVDGQPQVAHALDIEPARIGLRARAAGGRR